MKATECSVLDSSAWIAYFTGASPKAKKLIESDEQIFASVLSLFEVGRKLRRQGWPQHAEAAVAFMKQRAVLVEVSAELAEQSIAISLQHSLGAMDAIIYATAHSVEGRLVTLDNDFRSLPDVEVI